MSYNVAVQPTVRLTQPTARFEGIVQKCQSDDRDCTVYIVDGAVNVTELSEKVRKEALKSFEKGIFSKIVAGVGVAFLACTFVVMPVSSLIGYRIAGSHLAHAGVAFATFIIGLILLTCGAGDTPENLKKKKNLEDSLVEKVQTIRRNAGRNPFDFFFGKSKEEKPLDYFHPGEVLRLMFNASKTITARAYNQENRSKALIELNQFFNDKHMISYLANSLYINACWKNVAFAWEKLDLSKPIKEATEKKQALVREAQQVKGVTNFQGNLLKGVGSSISKTDETGSAILHGMGSGLNFLMDQTIGKEVESEHAPKVAQIEKEMYAALASKWDVAMGILDQINEIATRQ